MDDIGVLFVGDWRDIRFGVRRVIDFGAVDGDDLMDCIDLLLFGLDVVSIFEANFFVDFKTDDDIFRDGVLFDLEGVFFPFFAKTVGTFAAFFLVIVIVSGDVA